MLTDSLVNFVPPGSPLSLVAAAGVDIPSNVYDTLGVGVGIAPPNIIGNRAVFGTDLGIGDNRALLEAVVDTQFVTGNAASLNVAFQGAVDTGAGGGYQPGAWQTFMETGELTAAQLKPDEVIARFDWPPAFPENFSPRYLRLLFQVPAAVNFTAGVIRFAIVTMARDDWSNKFNAPNNFVVS